MSCFAKKKKMRTWNANVLINKSCNSKNHIVSKIQTSKMPKTETKTKYLWRRTQYISVKTQGTKNPGTFTRRHRNHRKTDELMRTAGEHTQDWRGDDVQEEGGGATQVRGNKLTNTRNRERADGLNTHWKEGKAGEGDAEHGVEGKSHRRKWKAAHDTWGQHFKVKQEIALVHSCDSSQRRHCLVVKEVSQSYSRWQCI